MSGRKCFGAGLRPCALETHEVERTRSHSVRDLLLETEVEGRAERTMEAGSTQRRFGRRSPPVG
jgi:hypothetical protein